jgi:cyclic pyranopterin phosphate synthase
MVDVGDKAPTQRECIARGAVRMSAATLAEIAEGRVAKGDTLAVARIAGVQAAKRTHEWIPLAHPLPLDAVEVELLPNPAGPSVEIEARVRAHARTGVEMEALVAVTAAGLTVYDMCKAIDKSIELGPFYLLEKSGGKSGVFRRKAGHGGETGT